MPPTLRRPFRGESKSFTSNVNPPSVAAGATATVNAALGNSSGVVVGKTVVDAAPPANFIAAGLVFLNAYVTATNTVVLVIQNPTGSAVDAPAGDWAITSRAS